MKENIKRILVPLDPTVYSQAATETACKIAKVHMAQVSGVAVLDSSEIRADLVPAVGPYYPGLIEAVQEKCTHADEILKDCMNRFADTCNVMNVAHLETEYEGIPARMFLESAIFYDLIVVGLRTAFHFETRKEKLETLKDILDRTITPILAVPTNGLDCPGRVLITFDGSLASARALRDFALFAQPYECDIKIVVAGKPDEAGFLLENASAFLQAHGFKQIEIEACKDSVSKALEKAVGDGVNLVVAGLHSKRFIHDLLVGSFANSLIERDDIALFLSH